MDPHDDERRYLLMRLIVEIGLRKILILEIANGVPCYCLSTHCVVKCVLLYGSLDGTASKCRTMDRVASHQMVGGVPE